MGAATPFQDPALTDAASDTMSDKRRPQIHIRDHVRPSPGCLMEYRVNCISV